MKSVVIIIIILIFGPFIFANGTVRAETSCSKSTLTVTSNIEIPLYTETTTTAYNKTLYGAAFNPIDPAMGINRDFLVTLATLEIKLNFEHILVYVNVNKKNVMHFMGGGNIKSNGEVYRSVYYGNNVYFVVLTRLVKSRYGYYTLTVHVEALNSQVEQWIKGSQYTVPIEFTVLEQENINSIVTNFGNL